MPLVILHKQTSVRLALDFTEPLYQQANARNLTQTYDSDFGTHGGAYLSFAGSYGDDPNFNAFTLLISRADAIAQMTREIRDTVFIAFALWVALPLLPLRPVLRAKVEVVSRTPIHVSTRVQRLQWYSSRLCMRTL
mmetsp:Transcript_27293/g.55182  ORF Transcript_27293/g.55182 Transcript_27293/m.55182 type:complete len:136 (-) Transcript_27293:585-992(-)